MDLLQQINQQEQIENEIKRRKNWDISENPEFKNMTIGEVFDASPVTAGKKYPFDPILRDNVVRTDGFLGDALNNQNKRIRTSMQNMLGSSSRLNDSVTYNIDPEKGKVAPQRVMFGEIKKPSSPEEYKKYILPKFLESKSKLEDNLSYKSNTSNITAVAPQQNLFGIAKPLKPNNIIYSAPGFLTPRSALDSQISYNTDSTLSYEDAPKQVMFAQTRPVRLDSSKISIPDNLKAKSLLDSNVSYNNITELNPSDIPKQFSSDKILTSNLSENNGIAKLEKMTLDARVNSNILSKSGPININGMSTTELGTMQPNIGPVFYNTNAVDNLQRLNRSAQVGKKIEENFTNPKSNSLRKYGAYALGALAATALVNTLFFGDKKGEQTNAQLYGQQPLY